MAKVLVTVVWIRAGGTSVGRLPCAFDLYTQITRSRYNEKRTDPKEFQLCIGWGREKYEKILKTLHCFKREPRNNTKI